MKPLSYCVRFQSETFAKFRYASCHSVDSNNSVASRVPILFFDCCPSTIRFLVISIFIWKSIKAFSWRTFSHIFQKVFKTSPLKTNLYTASSVHIEKLTVGIGAPRHHVIPNTINFGTAFPVSAESFMHQFLTQASTRQRISRLDRIIPHCQYGSATANRYALRLLISLANVRRCLSDYLEPSKCFSDERYCFWHERLLSITNVLCKWRARGYNHRSLRSSWQVNVACQTATS